MQVTLPPLPSTSASAPAPTSSSSLSASVDRRQSSSSLPFPQVQPSPAPSTQIGYVSVLVGHGHAPPPFHGKDQHQLQQQNSYSSTASSYAPLYPQYAQSSHQQYSQPPLYPHSPAYPVYTPSLPLPSLASSLPHPQPHPYQPQQQYSYSQPYSQQSVYPYQQMHQLPPPASSSLAVPIPSFDASRSAAVSFSSHSIKTPSTSNLAAPAMVDAPPVTATASTRNFSSAATHQLPPPQRASIKEHRGSRAATRNEFEKTAALTRSARRGSAAAPTSASSSPTAANASANAGGDALMAMQRSASLSVKEMEKVVSDTVPELTTDSPTAGSVNGYPKELPKRHVVYKYEVPAPSPTGQAPDTSKYHSIQRTFMSNLYLADDPDHALLPFYKQTLKREEDVTLVQLVNTPLLATGLTPLHMAAKWGKPRTLKRLLGLGGVARLRAGYICDRFPCTRHLEQREAPSIPPITAAATAESATTASGRPIRKRKVAPKEFKPDSPEPSSPTATEVSFQCPGCFRIKGLPYDTLTHLNPLQIIFACPGTTTDWMETTSPSLFSHILSLSNSALLDRDPHGHTLLHQAVASADLQLLEPLLAALDSTLLAKLLSCTDTHADTPLHLAARLCTPPLARALAAALTRTAAEDLLGSVNAHGLTPLDSCAARAREIVRTLGLDPDELREVLDLEWSAEGDVFRRALVARVCSASFTGSGVLDVKEAVRRVWLLAGEGEWSLQGFAGCRGVARELVGGMGSVEEVFDAVVEAGLAEL